jgi:hypothetical protein
MSPVRRESQGDFLTEPRAAAGHEDALSLEKVLIEHERTNPAIRIEASLAEPARFEN